MKKSFLNKSSLYFCIFFCLIGCLNSQAQKPVKVFSEIDFNDSLNSYEKNKKIPESIRRQALTALSFYPELKTTKLIFRLRKRKTPLTSRPRIFSVFRKKSKRPYVITISIKSSKRLTPIVFNNLPYNAQIGVLGHELGHIAYYKDKQSLKILGLTFKLLNSNFVDEFEYNTDAITIQHGLGYQLYDWSVFVRKALEIEEWKGAAKISSEASWDSINQRYMNPKTIQHFISENPIYKTLKE